MSLTKLNDLNLHRYIKWISRYKSTAPEPINKMKMFWENEMLLKSNLQYDLLSEDDKEIHDLHEKAIRKGHFTYDDPKTNERIRTRLRHFLRGKCCGNACRHCVYNHDNVIDEHKLRVRRFNSSFWTYPEDTKGADFDDSCYFDGKNLKGPTTRPLPSTRFDFSRR